MNKEFLNNISTYDYISFDVFDTLIFRTTNYYTDVFDLVEYTYNERNGAHLHNFKKARMLAEGKARSVKKGKEVTLDMIYANLSYSSQMQETIKKIEIECEIRNCVPNQCMIDVLNKCRAEGKKIVITTDMYLPRPYFLAVFQKLGILFDYLFISGEEGVTKRTGKLFQVVLNKLHISPSRIVHIGDDLNNDIEQPRIYGVNSMVRLLPKHIGLPYCFGKRKNNIQTLFFNFLQLGLNNHGKADSLFVIGYTIMGPLLWDFCKWLHQKKIECGLDRLLFVAREGYLINKCYELMYPKDVEAIDYVRLNKNLLRLPMLDADNSLEYFVMSIPPRKSLKWRDILAYLYIDNVNDTVRTLQSVFPNTDFSSQIDLDEVQNGTYENELLYLLNLQKAMILNQKKLLLDYLKKIGFMDYKIGLVNNSINGSGQKQIEDFLKQNHLGYNNILGLQFVKSEKCVTRLANRCAAWFSSVRISRWKQSRFIAQSLIFEHLMFESQGTAKCFHMLDENHIEVLCEKSRNESHNFVKIADLQEYACQFVRDYKKNADSDLQGLGLKRYLDFLLRPNRDDAMFIGELWDDDVDQDRHLINLSDPFKPQNSFLKDLPPNVGWIEGWLAVNKVTGIYKKVAHIRLLIRYYKTYLTKNHNQCHSTNTKRQ